MKRQSIASKFLKGTYLRDKFFELVRRSCKIHRPDKAVPEADQVEDAIFRPLRPPPKKKKKIKKLEKTQKDEIRDTVTVRPPTCYLPVLQTGNSELAYERNHFRIGLDGCDVG